MLSRHHTRDLWGSFAAATLILLLYAAVQSSSSPPPPRTRFLGIRFPSNVFLRRDGAPHDDGPFVGRNRLAPAVAAATASVSAARGGPLFAATPDQMCVCARVVYG